MPGVKSVCDGESACDMHREIPESREQCPGLCQVDGCPLEAVVDVMGTHRSGVDFDLSACRLHVVRLLIAALGPDALVSDVSAVTTVMHRRRRAPRARP